MSTTGRMGGLFGVLALFALVIGSSGWAGRLVAPSARKAHPPSHARSTETSQARPRAIEAEFPVSVPPGPAGPLAPDTCVGFWPADPARAPTVFVDPGHGGVDPGTESSPSGGILEKTLTLAISLDVRDLLVRAGYTVVLSRVTDTNVAAIEPGDLLGGVETADYVRRDLWARNECANASGAKALVGIYIDGNSDPSTYGSEALYCAQRPFGAASLRLASLVESDVVSAVAQSGYDLTSRGVFRDDEGFGSITSAEAAAYGHLMLLGPYWPPENLVPTMMPGTVVEPVFVTNPAEAAYVVTQTGRQAIASGIAQALEQFLPIPIPKHPANRTIRHQRHPDRDRSGR